MESTENSDDDTPPNSKIVRLIKTYDLGDDFGSKLEAYWTGDGVERKSLRDLADLFNRQLLKVAISDAGMRTLDGESENFYRLLTDDEVSSGVRTETRNLMKRNGVDIEQLERDFVSYQAIRTYLREVRGAEYNNNKQKDRVERTAESVSRLQSRTATIAQRNLEQLRNTSELVVDDPELFISVNVLCRTCGTQYTYEKLLEQGGCNCQ